MHLLEEDRELGLVESAVAVDVGGGEDLAHLGHHLGTVLGIILSLCHLRIAGSLLLSSGFVVHDFEFAFANDCYFRKECLVHLVFVFLLK